MTMAAGTRFGPYEIGAAAEVSGFGELYEARDHDQQRDVAFRVLRVDFSAAPDRLTRFEQEAYAAAELVHPNILTVHDIGTDAEAAYVVSEPMEGRTLGELLEAGPPPAATVASYAADLAGALAAAHSRGVVHRDLTPTNMLVTPDGRVKIVGLGLAAATQRASAPVGGAPLGTLRHISPEQLLGSTADQRSDMFAFGAIAHEMLTGTPAFSGGTLETMVAVTGAAPQRASVADVSAGLARIAEHCLQEAPEARPTADDVVVALRDLLSQPVESDEGPVLGTPEAAHISAAPSPPPSPPQSASHDAPHDARRFVRVAVALGGVALLAAVGFWLLRVTETADERMSEAASSVAPVSTASPEVPPMSPGVSPLPPSALASPLPVLAAGPQLVWFDRTGTELGIVGAPGDYGDLSLSPDGARVAVSVRDPGSEAADVWVFETVSGDGTRVTSDAADDIAPVWSADGQRVAFASSRAGAYDIYEAAIDGDGIVTAVVEASGDQIVSDWSSDGRYLLFHTDEPDVVAGANLDIWARQMPGGRPFAYLRTVRAASHATLSPEGTRVAYSSVEGGREDVYIAAFPNYDGRRRVSVSGGAWPRWSHTGDEVFYVDADNQLRAVAVNQASAELSAGESRVLFQLRSRLDRGYPYDVSADGRRVLVSVDDMGEAVAGATEDTPSE